MSGSMSGSMSGRGPSPRLTRHCSLSGFGILRVHMHADTKIVGDRMSTSVTQQCQGTPVNQQKFAECRHIKMLCGAASKEQSGAGKTKANYDERSTGV
jgi:hypothetical protein